MSTQAAKPPHVAQFHIHAAGGVCPVCYVAEASSWEDLYERLEKAKHIVSTTMELEQDVTLSKIRAMSKV
jgi:hypothetical protein